MDSSQLNYDVEIVKKTGQKLRDYHADMVDCLNNLLISNMFHNSHTLPPRRLREIGHEETENFLQFLHHADVAAVINRSKKLAMDGLGARSMIQLCGGISQFCAEKLVSENQETIINFMKAANLYMMNSLEGFIDEYALQLKKDQLYIREAFNKVAETVQKK